MFEIEIGRRFLFCILALLLAFGPVGSYAHGLEHLANDPPLYGEAEGGRYGQIPGHGKENAPDQPQPGRIGCDLFGAHVPMGAAAPGYALPSAAEAPVAATPLAPPQAVGHATCVPFLQRAPPHPLTSG